MPHKSSHSQHNTTASVLRLLLLVPAIAMVVASMFTACHRVKGISDLPLHEVVVVHSWDSIGEEGAYFTKAMEEEFEKHNLNVRVHHFYGRMLHRPPRVFAREDWPKISERIKEIKPEVILLNDDPLLEAVLGGYIDDSVLYNTPTVFAGVNALQRDSMKAYPLMTGFVDAIDISKNLEVVAHVTKRKRVCIELDYNRVDSVLRQNLMAELRDTVRYVDNTDFHLYSDTAKWMLHEEKDKMVVHTFSAARPYNNRGVGQSDSLGKANLQTAYKHSQEIAHLQVKYDIFSNCILDRSHKPQFTCIREQFNNDARTRLLAGYFTSTQQQIEDQVSYAARLINGESPQSIPVGQHKDGYFMDWNAMRIYTSAFSYNEFTNGSIEFTIVNAPIELDMPLEFTIYIAVILVLVIIIICVFVHYLFKWRNREQKEILDQLSYEDRMHQLLFTEANDSVWRITDDTLFVEKFFADHFGLPTNVIPLEAVKKFLHPDSIPAFNKLCDFRNIRGKKTLRMKLTPDGNTWSWAEIIFTATDETAARNEIYGLLLNIDKKKAIEEKLEQAQILSSEVALKENFLANISHDLKTPLGAITGFSEMLTMPDMELTDEDRAEYSTYIHQNTEMILSMIDDVMRKAQNQTADLDMQPKPVSITQIVRDCYQTNHVISPSHLTFSLEMDEPDCMVNIDLIRTKQVINNFLSNAFKFTPEGSVTLGWRYVIDEPEEWVEVYVADTGIGIKPENQQTLFGRYIKENETDRGTGLGLNISKTIVENQGGTIGVRSALGEGSTFFFRLRKYVNMLLVLITTALGTLSTTSCLHPYFSDRETKNVLVIHSYDSKYYAYPQFDVQLRQSLVSHGINPSIRNIYLDLENPRADVYDEYKKATHEIKYGQEKEWLADLILVEGDRAASFLLDIQTDSIDKRSLDLPMVFGAQHHPEWERVRKRPNIVVINDPTDYVANLNLAVKMSGRNAVEIELDYFPIDSLIREELRQAINRPPFIDDTDHHIKNLRHDIFDTEYKDSIVVMSYSAESPQRNTFEDTVSVEEGYARLERLFTHSWQYPSLSVKRDIYSTEIVDKTGRPQFTALKAGFGNVEARYLCGYFASYATVAQDLGHVGARLLKGERPSELTGMTHQKDYYMDYNAMKALGLNYNDYKDQFIIEGAPTSVTSPVAYYGVISLIVIVLIVGVLATLLAVKLWNERSITAILDIVKQRVTIRHMALNGADTRNVRSEENFNDIMASIHPDYSDKLPLMQQSVSVPGVHQYDIYADIGQTGEYHWWQLRFAVMYDKNGRHLDGMLFNIDADKQREKDLQLAIELAEEAKEKENFLTTISHELRTPLNAVVGFSDVMATLPRDQMTREELLNYGTIIKNNNNVLRGMIEDILMFSRIESHRLKYVNKEFLVKDLVEELAEEWRPLLPAGVQMHVFCLEPEVVMDNDRTRLKYILSQLLSNAVKFTTEGTILLGSMFHYNTDEIEFVVGDTGCGISKEKQDVMFGLFWKDNGFVPGLGLGLHIAYKLADGMKLRINVESKEGYGTKMLVSGKAELRMSLVDRVANASPQLE